MFIMQSIKFIDKGVNLPFVCPLNRVLSADDCYHGNGKDKCPYFLRYASRCEHGVDFWVVCKAPKKVTNLQLSFDFLF